MDYLTAPYLVAAAVLLDRLLGELPRWHPLVGFGAFANALERRLNRGASERPRFLIGVLALVLALLPFVAAACFVETLPAPWNSLVAVLLLYFAIGARSLREHALAVALPLQRNDLPVARRRLSYIVSRDTAALNESQVARAAVESVLENGADAIFAALFWFVLLGAPGVVLYRLSNTLDAMWGYRTPRFQYFGWAAARFDDLLNLIPARLTALTYALLGRTSTALRCWRTQAPLWYSPNAGPVMAAGAGALGIELGGPAPYHGQVKQRPRLGEGEAARPGDIARAVRLVDLGLVSWVVLLLLGGWLLG